MPLINHRSYISKETDKLLDFLGKMDINRHCNELRGIEPRISMVFSNRFLGKDAPFMTNANSYMSFNHFVKKNATNGEKQFCNHSESHTTALESFSVLSGGRPCARLG